MISQFDDFNGMLQSGQDLSAETWHPASVTFTIPGFNNGSPTAVACSGGSIRETSVSLMLGGALGEYQLAFRVQKTLLSNIAPQINTRLTYNGKSWMIMRVIDNPNDCAYLIGADNPAK